MCCSVQTESCVNAGQDELPCDAISQTVPGFPRHPLRVVLEGGLLRPVGNHLLHAGVLFRDLSHLLLDLLPNPRHPEEPCGPDLLQSVDQSSLQSLVISKPNCGSAVSCEVDVDDLQFLMQCKNWILFSEHDCLHLRGDVTEGQVGDALLHVPPPVVHLLGRAARPGQAVLADHHALGVALHQSEVVMFVT